MYLSYNHLKLQKAKAKLACCFFFYHDVEAMCNLKSLLQSRFFCPCCLQWRSQAVLQEESSYAECRMNWRAETSPQLHRPPSLRGKVYCWTFLPGQCMEPWDTQTHRRDKQLTAAVFWAVVNINGAFLPSLKITCEMKERRTKCKEDGLCVQPVGVEFVCSTFRAFPVQANVLVYYHLLLWFIIWCSLSPFALVFICCCVLHFRAAVISLIHHGASPSWFHTPWAGQQSIIELIQRQTTI